MQSKRNRKKLYTEIFIHSTSYFVTLGKFITFKDKEKLGNDGKNRQRRRYTDHQFWY